MSGRSQCDQHAGRGLRGAHASRVLVLASRRHELRALRRLRDSGLHAFGPNRGRKFVEARRLDPHAGRVRSPEHASDAPLLIWALHACRNTFLS